MGYILDKSRPLIATAISDGLRLGLRRSEIERKIGEAYCFYPGDKHALSVWRQEVTLQMKKVPKESDGKQGSFLGG